MKRQRGERFSSRVRPFMLDDEKAFSAAAGDAIESTSLSVQLSPREREALALIAKGFSLKESAKIMAVSRHTIVTFVRRLYFKLDVHSKSEAIFEALQLGLFSRESTASAARATHRVKSAQPKRMEPMSRSDVSPRKGAI